MSTGLAYGLFVHALTVAQNAPLQLQFVVCGGI